MWKWAVGGVLAALGIGTAAGTVGTAYVMSPHGSSPADVGTNVVNGLTGANRESLKVTLRAAGERPGDPAREGVQLDIISDPAADAGHLRSVVLRDQAGNRYVMRSRTGAAVVLNTGQQGNSPSRQTVQETIQRNATNVEAVMFQKADGTAVEIPRGSVLVAAPANIGNNNGGMDMASVGVIGAAATLFGLGGLALGGENPGPIALLAAAVGGVLAYAVKDDIIRVASGGPVAAPAGGNNQRVVTNQPPVLPTVAFNGVPSYTPTVPPIPGSGPALPS